MIQLTATERAQGILVAAAVIAAIIRVLKSDTKIPFDIPPRLRVFAALALGFVYAALQKIAAGTPWRSALFDGVAAFATAVVTHNVVIDSLRGGKELVVPGLMIPGAPPSPDHPPTIPPPPIPDDVPTKPTLEGDTL